MGRGLTRKHADQFNWIKGEGMDDLKHRDVTEQIIKALLGRL